MKCRQCPKKSGLKTILRKAGFDYRQGKGRHPVWFHPDWNGRIVIARKDGDDAPHYLEQQVQEALTALNPSQEEK